MPRYMITLSASNGEAKSRTRSGWYKDDVEAIDAARTWLNVSRALSYANRPLDIWDVWQGQPPYVSRKTIARNRIAPYQ